MKTKNVLLFSLFFIFSFFFVSTPILAAESDDAQKIEEKLNKLSEKARERRGQVLNAVSSIQELAERNNIHGEQLSAIVQNQEKVQNGLEKLQERSRLMRFLIGPDRKEIENIKNIIQENKEEISRLENLKDQMINNTDRQAVLEQVNNLKSIKDDVESELEQHRKGFSLFAWVFNVFSKVK